MKNIMEWRVFATVLFSLVLLAACNGKAHATGGSSVINQQAAFSNDIFRITNSGRYIFSGEYVGQILIEATRNDVVELVLDGMTIHNPNGPAILALRSGRVELILSDRTTNTISDGRHSNDETNAAIYIRHDLIISGNGTLNVNGNYRHGIRAQDFLTINGGIINVTAAGDALRGRDGVTVENGVFTLIAGGDGIRSNRASDLERGFITINGGTFTIEAGDDGIQAETTVTINGGNFRITAKDDGITTKGSVLITGGTINILDCYEGIEGLNVTITGGDINIIARDDGINAREHGAGAGSAVRGRAMTRTPLNDNIFIRITGGNINIHAIHGDGIDSNGHLFLDGGTVKITGPFNRPGEDAIDLDGIFTVTGGELITAGSVRSVSPQSTQPVLLVSYDRQFPSGALIEVKDTRGAVLLNHTAQNTFVASGFTSPGFAIGGTYSIYINAEKVNDITLTGMVTNIGTAGGRGGRMNQPRLPRP